MPNKSPEIRIRGKLAKLSINVGYISEAEISLSLQSLTEQMTPKQMDEFADEWNKKMGEHKSSSSRKELGGEGVPPISACCNASVKTKITNNGATYYHCEACERPCDLSSDFKSQEECKTTCSVCGKSSKWVICRECVKLAYKPNFEPLQPQAQEGIQNKFSQETVLNMKEHQEIFPLPEIEWHGLYDIVDKLNEVIRHINGGGL